MKKRFMILLILMIIGGASVSVKAEENITIDGNELKKDEAFIIETKFDDDYYEVIGDCTDGLTKGYDIEIKKDGYYQFYWDYNFNNYNYLGNYLEEDDFVDMQLYNVEGEKLDIHDNPFDIFVSKKYKSGFGLYLKKNKYIIRFFLADYGNDGFLDNISLYCENVSQSNKGDILKDGLFKYKVLKVPKYNSEGKIISKGNLQIMSITNKRPIQINILSDGDDDCLKCGYEEKVLKNYFISNIKKSAFKNNKYLKVLFLGGCKLKQIPGSLCKGCKILEEINICDNISKIGNKAFYGSKKIARIFISTKKIKTISKRAFYSGYKGNKNTLLVAIEKTKYKKYRKKIIKSRISNKNVVWKKYKFRTNV